MIVPRYVALLRGVNVGRAKRVPMTAWKASLGTLGATDVDTLLNSGNAVFSHSSRFGSTLAARVQAALLSDLGVEAPVIVKSAAEMAAIVQGNPLAGELGGDASRLLVAFAAEHSLLQALSPLSDLVQPQERFVVGDHAAYLWCANGILESKAGEALLGQVGRAVTTRNWATVQKIAALL